MPPIDSRSEHRGSRVPSETPEVTSELPAGSDSPPSHSDLPPLPTAARVALFVVGALLLIAGLIGLMLPIVPQAVPLVLGFALLSLASQRFNRFLIARIGRWPRITRRVQSVQVWMHKRLRKKDAKP